MNKTHELLTDNLNNEKSTPPPQNSSGIHDFFHKIKQKIANSNPESTLIRLMGAMALGTGIALILTVFALVPGIVLIILGAFALVLGFGEDKPNKQTQHGHCKQ